MSDFAQCPALISSPAGHKNWGTLWSLHNLFQFIPLNMPCSVLSDFTLFIALFTLLGVVLFPICLFVFGWFWQFLHKHSVRVVLTYAKLVPRPVIMSFYWWLSLSLRLQVLPCFYILFNIMLIWYRSDLISFSLLNTGYVGLHNQILHSVHTTLSKLVFTSHHVCFLCIVICSLSSAYKPSVSSPLHYSGALAVEF